MQQHNNTLPASVNAAVSGASTDLYEAIIFNPLTVLKNHKQISPNKPFLQILNELHIKKLTAGTIATAQRNVTCSCIAMGTFGVITDKDGSIETICTYRSKRYVVAVGDSIGGGVVLDISSNKVHIKKSTEDIVLEIY